MPKIIEAWRKLGFRLPSIDAGTERYEFTLRLRYIHLLADEDRNWLHGLGQDWSEPEALTLVVARHEGEVDNAKIRSVTGMHSADVTRMFGSLRNRGFLQMQGDRRSARYELGPACTLGEGNDLPRQLSLEDNDSTLGHKAPPLGDKPSTLGDNTELPAASSSETAWATLERIAAPVRENRRIDPATRARIVFELCRIHPLSVRELATLIGRSPDHARAIIRALQDSGDLIYTIPDQPSHPNQRYRAAAPSGD